MGGKYTEAQKRAAEKYIAEHSESVSVRVKKGTKARWKAAAEERGKSLNQFIIDSVEKEISK